MAVAAFAEAAGLVPRPSLHSASPPPGSQTVGPLLQNPGPDLPGQDIPHPKPQPVTPESPYPGTPTLQTTIPEGLTPNAVWVNPKLEPPIP